MQEEKMISSTHTISLLALLFVFHFLLGNLQHVASTKIPLGDLTGVPPFHVSQKSLLNFMKLGDETMFHVPALYVFGDSTVDSGNNNFLATMSKGNYTPYGVDFDGGKPTGRFTNGRTEADFIAQMLGLPLPPPYLGLSHYENNTLSTGINYGSAGCGILSTGKNFLGACLPFYQQIRFFETTLNNLKHRFKSKERFAHYLSKSLLLIDIGNADMSFDYNSPGSTISGQYTVQQYARLVAKEFSRNLKKLYKLGARKFLVNNLGAMGCIPEQVNRHNYKTLCVKASNDRAIVFNKILTKMLPKLQSKLYGSKFVLGDAYKVLLDVVRYPNLYGLNNTRNSCCTVGLDGNATLPCVLNLEPCNNRNRYAFFDAYHLTEAVHFLITKRCSKESSICSPINLVELLQA